MIKSIDSNNNILRVPNIYKYIGEKGEHNILKNIHTECGEHEDSRNSELNISHCLIKRKNKLKLFVMNLA